MNESLIALDSLLAKHDWDYNKRTVGTRWIRGLHTLAAVDAESMRLLDSDPTLLEEILALHDKYRLSNPFGDITT
jgi:hypothetical protein